MKNVNDRDIGGMFKEIVNQKEEVLFLHRV